MTATTPSPAATGDPRSAPASAGALPGAAPAPPVTGPAEHCPLCGGLLDPAQDWCLHCGAAARTRLAAAPRWQGPIVAVAVVAALALGVLAASLVKLAADAGPAPAAITHVFTTAVAGAPASTPDATTPTTGGAATAPTTAPRGASTAPAVTTPHTSFPAPTTSRGSSTTRLGGTTTNGHHVFSPAIEKRIKEIERRAAQSPRGGAF